MDPELRRSTIFFAVLAALLLTAWGARTALGLEWNADSVRSVVAGFGLWGPAVFVVLITLRTVLLIPSQILLVAAGLCFGAIAGTLYGGIGITASGCLAFGAARWLGREAVASKIPSALHGAFDLAGSKAGAAMLLLGTAYPVGPITAYHAGAGLTAMAFPVFVAALACGSIIRSATYTFFGSSLAEGDWERILAAGAVLATLTLLPLAHPRGRRWLRERMARSAGDSAPPP